MSIYCCGRRHKLGLMRHACLAFIVLGADGVGHRKLPRERRHPEIERVSIDSNSQVSSHAAEPHSPFLILLVYNIPCLTAYL
jgi:hypothetical protein